MSRRRIKQERMLSFKKDLVKLYRDLEDNIEVLCKKYEVGINCWYSPSTIPQPKFVVGKFAFDADDLYSEKELTTKLFKK